MAKSKSFQPVPGPTPGVPPTELQSSLDTACARTVARAKQAGHPILLAVSERAEVEDPLAVLQALPAIPGEDAGNGAPETSSRRRFYFEHPEGGFALAAGGCAQRWAAPESSDSAGAHSARFESVRRPLEAALQEAETFAPPGQEPAGAYAVGGFAFFGALSAQQWPGFAPADLGLPAWLAIRRGSERHIVVQAVAAPGDEAGALRRRIDALQAAVRKACSAPPVELESEPIRVEGREPPGAREQWTAVVRTARDAIRAGRFRKVVLARPFDLVCTPPPRVPVLLARLRSAYPDCYTFLADPGAGEAFLGATPERLARLDRHPDRSLVILGALAGTYPRGSTPEADAALKRGMREDPKEREEHAIVVDAIRTALSGLGRLEVPDEPEVRTLRNVFHLFSQIVLTPYDHLSLLALIERLHPTPAVGGMPREAALEAMRTLETMDRGWYGAPLGWLNSGGEGEFAVSLRAGLVQTDAERSGRVRLFAGGGIVADSDPEREFEETRIKFQPMLGALGQE